MLTCVGHVYSILCPPCPDKCARSRSPQDERVMSLQGRETDMLWVSGPVLVAGSEREPVSGGPGHAEAA